MADSLLDGHLVLDHALDDHDRGPAIDLARSISRTAHAVADREHLDAIHRIRSLLNTDRQNVPSLHNRADSRLQHSPAVGTTSMHAAIAAYMRQELNDSCTARRARQALLDLVCQQRPARAA
jgi:flagellar biosynthesis/type III secretory pathway ATPase